ncbi:hypothetical protein [Pantoea dispersa]|nr:hypothetical protein [Pantoea dispersa]
MTEIQHQRLASLAEQLQLESLVGVNAKIIGRFSPFLMSAIGH